MNAEFYQEFDIKDFDADRLPPLDLAYVGDCAYELAIRTCLLSEGATSVDKLNRKASQLAKAATQSKMISGILDRLSEEEQGIYRRGRNAKSYSPSKSSTLGDYHRATGFEAVVGWLYLKKEYARMYEIIHMGWDFLKADVHEQDEKLGEQGNE